MTNSCAIGSDHTSPAPRGDTRPVRRPEIAAPRHRLAGTLLPLRHQGRRACLQLHCVHCRTRLGHASRRPRHRAPGPTPPWRRYAVGRDPASVVGDAWCGWSPLALSAWAGRACSARRPNSKQRYEPSCMATTRSPCWAKEVWERRRLRRASDRSLPNCASRDRIVGIDADTAFGRLSSRIDPRAAGSFWELTTDTNLRSFTDITARLGRNSAGLYVLAGQPASGPRRVLDPAIYREAALRLDHHFAISVIDCGSSMEAAVTQEVLRDVDALIVVSSPWADGASAAANTIEWLSDYGLTGLLRRSIVVLNDSDGHADKRTKSLLAQEFIDHGQPVVEVPFDPHLRPGGHRYEPRNGPDDAAENPAGRRDGDGVLRVATRRRTRQPAPVTWLADPVGNSRIARAQACKTSISAPIVESWRAQRGAQCGQREKSCRCSRAVHIQGISPPLFRRPLEPAVQAAVASCRLGRHPVVAHRVTVALGQGSQLAQRECPRPA